ncbi:ribonucleoside-diphosphate reductase subunit alpha [Pelagicoccus sp. SDUM812005]|uniref:ribonucleoside-diphosphate reductase subunit alpha n=1 Tax=Pelagicoccus sp. SDUM812005 TaxID=3041257 RepID=UPI00280F856E|nr:ribonucleoside-diphosphate reductase subunit alpha [Pelagicoccus sp. SDUM812005]MDQ8182440.1 ribonucleoside-diphosphate reductase subunit alpha [Pelagicoccus sp. SDUM812005]
MINPNLQEDLALKRLVTASREKSHGFDWRSGLADTDTQRAAINVVTHEGEATFDLSEIVDTIGNALANVLLSKNETNVFNEENRQWVCSVARQVCDKLESKSPETLESRVGLSELYDLIENTLVDNNAYDVAKSMLINRQRKLVADKTAGLKHVRLIRRDRKVVPWKQEKIEIAVRRAFLSLELNSDPAVQVAEAVTERVQASAHAFIEIEEVQDIVQEELMRQGHFKVAAHYVLYREERRQMREQEALQLANATEQDSMVVVKKADGSTYFWDGIDLKKRIEFASIGLDLCLTAEEIEHELRRAVFDEISESDLEKTITLNARTLIEQDADFAKFAARIKLSYMYEETLGWDIVRDGIGAIKTFHQKKFKEYIRHGILIGRLNPKLKEYDIAKLARTLDPSADLEFDYLGIQTLYDRYLIVDKTQKKQRRIETPQFFWMRVAMGLFHAEEDCNEKAKTLYRLYKSRRFCSSTPTLFNSGTCHSQLSSCYLYYVEDSIEGIMQRGIADNAYLSKWAGGLGGSWTAVRGTGSYIGGTNGESQGIVPFLKLHNDQLIAVNQGGKRRGSGCAYLETWHNDLYDFLELRKNTGDDRRRCHDMNTANWIPDLFMKRMEARQSWSFFRSSEVPELHDLYGEAFEKKYVEYEAKAAKGEIWSKEVPAIEVWKKMLSMIFETGHPWITFKDPCNVRSPQDHCGVIHSSNLCTEITLNTSQEETAVCNLGSIVLDQHLDKDGNIDHKKLRETVQTAIRALDNVIDINFYPTEAAKLANSRHRPIGLGIMGLQNCLYVRNTPFASQEAVEFNDEIMEAVAYYAIEASSDLAAERGTYQSYKGSKWDRGLLPQDTIDLLEKERGTEVDVPRGGKMDWTPVREKIAKHGMRNSNVMAIAPTATISNITGTSPCIEPGYKNLFVKSNLSGEFIILNQHLVRDLKERGLWNRQMLDDLKYFDGELDEIEAIPDDLKAKYKTAFAIDYSWLVLAAARRQKWIDQSQSVNLFIASPDMKTLSHMYRAAWRHGLKTTYYLRSLGASTIEKATVGAKKEVRGIVGGKATAAEPEVCESCQ